MESIDSKVYRPKYDCYNFMVFKPFAKIAKGKNVNMKFSIISHDLGVCSKWCGLFDTHQNSAHYTGH